MDSKERKAHWETIFSTKDTSQVSWYQTSPSTSLRLIEELELPKTANIVEIGSGDSNLADFLLKSGYTNISLLDISVKALNSIKKRLGEKADNIEFITADICQFASSKKYDLLHDRAVFHFLSSKNDIASYLANVSNILATGSYFIIGTFSDHGPNMCSGITVQQYTSEKLCSVFSVNFKKIKCFTENHTTPSGQIQQFVFCVFQRK